MRLVTLSGGIGNQMFQYAFYLALKQQYGSTYLNLKKIRNEKEHEGYELERVFSVHLSRKEHLISNLIMLPVLGNLVKHLLFRHKYRERIYYSYTDNARIFQEKPHTSVHFVGYWQTEKYFESIAPLVRKAFEPDELKLNKPSQAMANELKKSSSSVSIHIRRGDYLKPNFYANYGNICTESYYESAIQWIKRHVENPVFYVFTNDMPWAKEHLKLDRVVFVDWNTTCDSWQDMYLMSQCTHNIIANSSFSWWGAWLNKHPNKQVIAPSRWINTQEAVDAVPQSWIRV